MPDPLASLLVPHIYQSTDAAINEVVTIPASGPYTYKLGTGLTPAYPANLPLIPSGAAPLDPPPAMTAGATLTTGALVANGAYKWAMTLVTKFGETTPGTLLTIAALGAGVTGQTLNLPAGQTGTAAAPVILRRIWRTKTTGSQLYLVAEIDDANVTTYVDEVSDTLLVTTAPTVNSSGLEGAVALSGTNGAGGSTWTEIAPSASFTTAGQFKVDYTISTTGGVLTFGSLDAGKTPTANYTAAALLGSAYFLLVQAAFTALHSYLPQPGVAGVDSSGRVAAPGAVFTLPTTGAVDIDPLGGGQKGRLHSFGGFQVWSANCTYDGTNWHYDQTGTACQVYMDSAGNLVLRQAASGTAGATITWTTPFDVTPVGDMTVGGHLRVTGATPTTSSFAGGAFGTGATGSITGTDNHGTIVVNVGSSPGTGLGVQILFAASMLNVAYSVTLSPQQGASFRGFSHGAKTVNGWNLYCDVAPTPGATYTLDYNILS